MFYIKLDDQMNLVITEKEAIYRGDNLNQKITYLVPLKIGDIDMLSATIFLNYIRSDGTPDVVILERQEEKYNESYYRYFLPVTCKISKYAGAVCTWMQICSGSASNPVVSKSGECILQIQESKDMDEYLGDRQVTAMYQLQKQVDDGFTSIDSAIDSIIAEKADNITFNSEDSTIQLVADGQPIGDKITVSSNVGTGIEDMRISVDGELLVFFDDGSIKNLGKVVGEDGVVYVPHIDEHKVLTFTIEREASDIPESVDLNPNDEWSGIADEESGVVTDYVWEGIEPN